ncbi:uncharacterized protein MONBRDRAFT_38296 [Monosiga brevicollis MX1]|uniref:40S ribosomal protein S29 n=1 Tax=Monosiga brevicollis TaxID=81824 RepID=A9V6U9_MONBE|nr:uncharacterized protein MONBRDRAFT_38296 [Monosiga brevicollis MX1]EDQ86680.1 predicted protein [Monosiga brevicollis MX1]|eukprot:XP_001748516.1 hypothetical protein [Monosiga brevicollis MX1]
MGHNQVWNSHPKKYGPGSRQCRVCGNRHGLIRKYGMNICRQCFQLYAKDIGFVKGYAGDSITAGFAMQDLPLEFRGTVYSAGGDPDALTIGNFLKHYNPNLKGQATGTTIPLTKEGKGLNFAVSEARVHDLPGQIERLSAKLNTSEYAGVRDEWKLLVLFIGANDICECKSMTAEAFETELTTAMDMIHANFPKTFVSMMTIFNISDVWDVHSDKEYCNVAVPILHECSCLENNQTSLQRMDELGMQINQVTARVAAKYAALNDPLFTAVVQPAIQNVPLNTFPKDVVQDLLSDVDCFHPSLCTDQGFAVGVWNNMFQAQGNKSTSLNPLHPPAIYCPQAGEYLQ